MTRTLASLLLLCVAAANAAAECTAPESPNLPAGASSTLADMLDAQKAVKTFQTENMAYMKCLEQAFTAAEKASKKGSDEEKAAAAEEYQRTVNAYNAAVSEEEAVAGRFNTEIRAYKDANPD